VTGKRIIIIVVFGVLLSLFVFCSLSLTAMNVGGLSPQNIETTLSSIVSGSSEMKFNRRENRELRNAVFEHIQRRYQRDQLDLRLVTGTELVNTLVQLRGMRWKLNDLTKDTQKSLLDAIEHPSAVFTTAEICDLIPR
jgi:hypothetical protein